MLLKRNGSKILWIIIVVSVVAICVSACVSVPQNFSSEKADLSGVDYGGYIDYTSANLAPVTSGTLSNLVIFICFSDEDVSSVQNSLDSSLIGLFNGSDNSLKDYYEEISYGKISVNSFFPLSGETFFVYRAAKSRSYYKSITQDTAPYTRYKVESELLNAAVEAADGYFDYSGKVLDANSDGYVDSVTFMVSGGYDNTDQNSWGGLLWPHAWELDTLSKLSGKQTSALNGITVNRFTLNFVEAADAGLLCHETGHVLGMPDLYHYDYDTDRIQVGKWDLMHLNNSVPQYPTSYLRYKYLDVLNENQVENITESGTYTLKPVSLCNETDIVAYRMVISEYESIWIEYRSDRAGVYDSELPGSGLVVYRVNSKAEGNVDGRYQNTRFPDEVYVYRPTVATTGTLRNKELTNLNYAFLSPDNGFFTSLGKTTTLTKYDEETIFLTDGSNTGITVRPLSKSETEIIFTVDPASYAVEGRELYVESDVTITFGETPLPTVKYLTENGTYRTLASNEYELIYDATSVGQQQAKVMYAKENGETVEAYFLLTIIDSIAEGGVQITSKPAKTVYSVGEEFDLSGFAFEITYLSGKKEKYVYSEQNSSDYMSENYDTALSGTYSVKVTHIPTGAELFFDITVRSTVIGIKISEKDSDTLVAYGDSLTLTVTGILADRTERVLDVTEYSVTGFYGSEYYLNKAQTVTVKLKQDPSITATKTVYLVKTLSAEAIFETAPKTVYSYGEALDLSGGKIKFTFEGLSLSVEAENFYYDFNATYNPVRKGKQSLTATLLGAEITLTVTVLSPGGSELVAAGEKAVVNTASLYVLFDGETTVLQAENMLSSYLTVKLYAYGNGNYYLVNGRTNPDYLLRAGMKIELVNADGKTVLTYKIYIKGDINGDGRADSSDVDGWAEALFKNVTGSWIFLDMNGDGSYGLTDFVLLNKTYGGKNA